jgi:hypothetical protein
MYKVKIILKKGHVDLDDFGSFEVPIGYETYFKDKKGDPISYKTIRVAKHVIKGHQKVFKGEYDYEIEIEGDPIAKAKEQESH